MFSEKSLEVYPIVEDLVTVGGITMKLFCTFKAFIKEKFKSNDLHITWKFYLATLPNTAR